MNRRAPGSIRSARPEPLRKSASQQAYGRRGRARLTHPAHRASTPERTFDVLRRPDIFTCPRQPSAPISRIAGAKSAYWASPAGRNGPATSTGSIGRDLVFDPAERRPGQHPLGDEFIGAGVGTARDDRSPEALTQAGQIL